MSMRLVGIATTPDEIVECLAQRRCELGVNSRMLDDFAGLAPGHTSKIACGVRGLGDISLPTLLATLGLRLAIVADDALLPPQTRAHVGAMRQRQRPAETVAPAA